MFLPDLLEDAPRGEHFPHNLQKLVSLDSRDILFHRIDFGVSKHCPLIYLLNVVLPLLKLQLLPFSVHDVVLLRVTNHLGDIIVESDFIPQQRSLHILLNYPLILLVRLPL